MKHIVVIDDEKNIRDLIQLYLEKEGFSVSLLENGQNLLPYLKDHAADLLILDIMMPGINGLDLCRELRKNHSIPVVFVSARTEEFDRILGLELGGDDYLTKPFSPRELVARVKNILRRLDPAPPADHRFLRIQDCVIDVERRYLESSGQEVKLTSREYDLLLFLVNNRSISFTRDTLIERIWGYDYAGDARAIDDLVKRLRRKLQLAGSALEIVTVRGYGYRIDG